MEGVKVKQLKTLAKEKGIRRYSRLRKDELIDSIKDNFRSRPPPKPVPRPPPKLVPSLVPRLYF